MNIHFWYFCFKNANFHPNWIFRPKIELRHSVCVRQIFHWYTFLGCSNATYSASWNSRKNLLFVEIPSPVLALLKLAVDQLLFPSSTQLLKRDASSILQKNELCIRLAFAPAVKMIRFTFQRDGQTERRKSYFRIIFAFEEENIKSEFWVTENLTEFAIKKWWSVKSILMVTFMICPHCCVLHVKLEQLRKVLPCNQLENRPPRSVNDVLEPSTSCSNCLNHKVTLSSNQNVSHFLEKKFRSIPTELVTNYIQLF